MPSIRDLATHPYPYVTVQELAECLRVHPETIYRHIEKGALRAVRIGAAVRISIVEACRYAGEPPSNGE